ncbi:MAG: hypothetical protein Q9M92_11635 [Enterobacterales bacterium]|nr:hypothetical protein [Enterobacterales bacterium]
MNNKLIMSFILSLSFLISQILIAGSAAVEYPVEIEQLVSQEVPDNAANVTIKYQAAEMVYRGGSAGSAKIPGTGQPPTEGDVVTLEYTSGEFRIIAKYVYVCDGDGNCTWRLDFYKKTRMVVK